VPVGVGASKDGSAENDESIDLARHLTNTGVRSEQLRRDGVLPTAEMSWGLHDFYTHVGETHVAGGGGKVNEKGGRVDEKGGKVDGKGGRSDEAKVAKEANGPGASRGAGADGADGTAGAEGTATAVEGVKASAKVRRLLEQRMDEVAVKTLLAMEVHSPGHFQRLQTVREQGTCLDFLGLDLMFAPPSEQDDNKEAQDGNKEEEGHGDDTKGGEGGEGGERGEGGGGGEGGGEYTMLGGDEYPMLLQDEYPMLHPFLLEVNLSPTLHYPDAFKVGGQDNSGGKGGGTDGEQDTREQRRHHQSVVSNVLRDMVSLTMLEGVQEGGSVGGSMGGMFGTSRSYFQRILTRARIAVQSHANYTDGGGDVGSSSGAEGSCFGADCGSGSSDGVGGGSEDDEDDETILAMWQIYQLHLHQSKREAGIAGAVVGSGWRMAFPCPDCGYDRFLSSPTRNNRLAAEFVRLLQVPARTRW
jgi:hypothetical protein